MPGPISDTLPSLPERMRALAAAGHERAIELQQKANALDAVCADANAPPQRLLGAWARARRMWCECTGEDLI